MRLVTASLLGLLAAAPSAARAESTPRLAAIPQLPLTFEAAPTGGFFSHAPGYVLSVDPSGAVMRFARTREAAPAAVRMMLAGGNARAHITGLERQAGHANYLIGNDAARWRTSVPLYGRVEIDGVYPHIDLAYYGRDGSLEYDFIVAPGGDPHRIVLAFPDADRVGIDEHGDAVIDAGGETVRLNAPVAYQRVGGERRTVAAAFERTQEGQLTFTLGAYDRRVPLVIDPVLVYSTIVSGAQDGWVRAIAVDRLGNTFVTGSFDGQTWPSWYELNTSNSGDRDVFVMKLTASGTLAYSTYVGATSRDDAVAIAVDPNGVPFVAGTTVSPDFPITPGAVQPHCHVSGATCNPTSFVFQLGASGATLTYSTFVGGSTLDLAAGLVVDYRGAAWLTGETESGDFPTTADAREPQMPRAGMRTAFVTKLNPLGTAFEYSTFLGGTVFARASGIAYQGTGDVYVTGVTTSPDFPATPGVLAGLAGSPQIFVTKFSEAGALRYSARFGGSFYDEPRGIAVDAFGRAFVTGTAHSTDFPVVSPLRATMADPASTPPTERGDAFVAVLADDAATLVFSTYLGGSGLDVGNAIAVHKTGALIVVGQTVSPDFPLKNAFDATCGSDGTCEAGAAADAFVAQITPWRDGTWWLTYGTFLGGSGFDAAYSVAMDVRGNPYVVGQTSSPLDGSSPPRASNGFPVTAWYTTQGVLPSSSAFAVKIRMLPEVSINNVAVYEGNTGLTDFTVRVTLSEPALRALILQYDTRDGTAVGTSDFVARCCDQFMMFRGDTFADIHLQLRGDYQIEGNETFTVKITAIEGATAENVAATVTIVDDDHTPRVDTVTPLEGPPGTVVTVTGAYFTEVTSVLFGPCAATFEVDPYTADIKAVAPSGNCFGRITVATMAGVGNSAEDFYVWPEASVSSISLREGNGWGFTRAFLTIRLSTPALKTATVTVSTRPLTARAETDYRSLFLNLSFQPGEQTKMVSVMIVADNIPENNEQFQVLLSNASGMAVPPAPAVVTIVNDDSFPFF